MAFRSRLRHDSALVLVGHTFLLAMVAAALWDDGLGMSLIWWMGAIALATAARAACQHSAGAALQDRWMFGGARMLVLLHALTWGVGAGALLPRMAPDGQAILLIGFSGIVGSAVSALVADQASMRCFVTGMYGPVLLRLLTGGLDRHGVVMAGMIAMFAVAALLLNRRAHRALVDNLRATALLSLSQQEKARESAYLAGVLRSVPTAVAVLDDAKRVRSVNPRFELLFGYTAEETVGQALDALLVPDNAREEQQQLESRLKHGERIEAEVIRRTKSGAAITVRLSAAMVVDPGSPGMVVVYEDVTQQRAVTEAIREREARLRQLVDSNILGIGFWDASGVISEANEEYLRIIGHTREDLAAGLVNFRTFSPPEYAAINQRVLEQMAQGATVAPWEAEVICKDGRRTPILVGVAPLNDRRDQGVVFMLDIADRRRAEEQLQWKTALLEAQVHSSIDGILVVDQHARTILKNQRLMELWGVPPVIANDDDDGKLLQFVLTRTRRPQEFLARVEYLYAHPDEAGRDEIELTNGMVLDRYSAPVTGHSGERYGRIWTFRDITESKRAEQAMREARDLAERSAQARSMFLANMSHEIRTPMNAILGMIEIVLDSDLTVDQRHSLEVVGSSAESLLAILNDVLDYSKIEADRLDLEEIPFDLQRLIQTSASLLAPRATQKDLELVVDLSPEVPGMVRGDPTRLRQVLTNLVGNAIKFTERGEIIVGVQPESMADGRPGVRLSVRDTGVGIAAEKLASIFEEFTQADGSTSRRFGGTGLGLTISQRLVGLMGGRIAVTSELGCGSEFKFTLPLIAEPGLIPGVSAKPASLAGRSILVVDDTAANRRIFRHMLTAEGARVEEAGDAAAGLAFLRAARDAGQAPALAIVDARMPVADGFALVRQIKSDPSLASIPLLVLTSSGQRGDAARCRELGVSGYLTKPVSPADLVEAVATILGGGGAGGTERSVITRHSLAEARRPLRILLAEDNAVNQEVAARMLHKRGHTVDLAGNGREALAAVRRSRYDLVLMDIQMPEVDGFEATAAIRALPEGRELPIIALTAHAFSAERERCLASGMNGFLSKPFKAEELFAVVEGLGLGVVPATVAPCAAAVSAAVDLEVLRGQLREAGAEAALDGIVDTFLETVPPRVQALRDALTGGTQEEVATAAHALKSSAGAIGAGPLATFLAEIEAAGRKEALGDKAVLSDRVQDATAAVLTNLRAYRGKAA